jgi:hypothetical protein
MKPDVPERLDATAPRTFAFWSILRLRWPLERHREMTDGDMVEAFQAIAGRPNAFAFPIEHVKPKR